MGNCVWRALPGTAGGQGHAIKVVTSTGGIMEFHSPVTAERITNEFPGYGIFQGYPSPAPLIHNEPLVGGHLYYLLPLDHRAKDEAAATATADAAPPTAYGAAPYRMSFDSNVLFGRWRRAGAESFPLCQKASSGVWKVKLVISPEQLAEILAEQSHTEALIDSVRTVAKCNGGYPASASSSDEWSLSSGRRTSEREN